MKGSLPACTRGGAAPYSIVMNYCNAARGHTTEDELEGASGSGQSETTSGMKHRVALGLKPTFQAFQLLLLFPPLLIGGFSKIAPESSTMVLIVDYWMWGIVIS